MQCIASAVAGIAVMAGVFFANVQNDKVLADDKANVTAIDIEIQNSRQGFRSGETVRIDLGHQHQKNTGSENSQGSYSDFYSYGDLDYDF